MSSSQSFVILHSNDIHGRIEGLARIATLVERIRAEKAPTPVLYLDGGDVEESSVRLSNLTNGTAMHRLLDAAGCQVATVGNGGILRYGYQILTTYSQAVRYPLLLANLRTPEGDIPEGSHASVILQIGTLRLGIIGLSENLENFYTDLFHMQELPAGPLVRELTHQLRQDGADTVILLSHMGLEHDRRLAAELQEEIPLIIGAHTHNLLPEGERLGKVMIAQAGEYAQHLGYLDLHWDGRQLQIQELRVLPTADISPSPTVQGAVTQMIAQIEEEVAELLGEVIAELAEPLSLEKDRECKAANLMADMLRERMQADVAIVIAGNAFLKGLPAGPLTRGSLWEACPSPANPGVIEMTGAQLLAAVQHGLDPEVAAQRPRPLRGEQQGLLHLSGATMRSATLFIGDVPLQLDRTYRVAGSDWELGGLGNYVKKEWGLQPTYEIPTILREGLEDYLRSQQGKISVSLGRIS